LPFHEPLRPCFESCFRDKLFIGRLDKIASTNVDFLDIMYCLLQTGGVDLMAGLRKVIKAKKLTQAKAAKLLGVSQSRVSDLVRGKWDTFSREMLITLATRAGLHVTVKTAA
jgi:predicted XRE-type DNA-binding protein